MGRKGQEFNDRYFVQAHELSRSGLSIGQIAAALGVRAATFKRWVAQKPALAEAIESGKTKAGPVESIDDVTGGQTFLEYVYRQLPPELQKLWEEIEAIDDDAEKDDVERAAGGRRSFARQFRADRIDRLFQQAGVKRARQSLWIHALVASNFNANEACRKVNVSPQAVDNWRRTEPDFDELVTRQIHGMKRAFMESCLFRGAAAGQPSLIIFGLKSLYPEQYNPARKMDVKSQHTNLTASVDLNRALESMPLEDRRRLLDQLRASRASASGPKTVEALPPA